MQSPFHREKLINFKPFSPTFLLSHPTLIVNHYPPLSHFPISLISTLAPALTPSLAKKDCQ